MLRPNMPLVIAFSVHFPYSHRTQVLPIMVAEIAQQLGEHGRFLHLWSRAGQYHIR
jgi:muconolactone delta-isomerase